MTTPPLPPVPDPTPQVEVLEVICRLKSGNFESKIELPLAYTKTEMSNFIQSWLAMMAAGIAMGATK